jgi:5-methylcytosine-specific restriction endonuclease McrA
MKRDKNSCVVCGRGRESGVELQVDHNKPKDQGGKATIANGETLCAQHNFQKKNYKQTESGKRFFIHLYEAAKANNDKQWKIFAGKFLKYLRRMVLTVRILWTK